MFGLSTVGAFLYFLLFLSLISITMYVSKPREITIESYFFGNRNKNWFILGISFLTCSIVSPYFIGLVWFSKISGVALVYGAVSILMLIFLASFLTPIYLKLKINTLPEYFEKRFNKSCRFFLSAIYILYNISIRLVVILILGSIFISRITGADSYSSLLFFLIITGIYIIVGGLQAEIYVNIIQMFLMIISVAGFLIWVIYQGEGGNLIDTNISSFFGFVNDPELSLTGIFIGLPILGFWFWCTDQCMVQKILCGKNISSVRKAALLSAVLQIIPVLIFILPGFVIYNLFEGASSEESLNTIFYSGILPESLRGGLIIGVAAILTASFASLFNSTSTLVTFDFYKSLNPSVSDRKLILVGRMTTIVLLIFSIMLVPVAQGLNFEFCLSLIKAFSFFISMISAVFIVSLLNNSINGASALATLVTISALIVIRIFMEIFFNYSFLNSGLISWFISSNFLEFCVFIFILSGIFMFTISRMKFVQNIVFGSLKRVKIFFLRIKYIWNLFSKVFI
ncbi:MAG: sodium:solute symporter family transporter [Ignavibacteria bacterium]